MSEKEYIEREAMIENIKRVYCTDCNSYGGVRCRACGTCYALDMIEDAPAADVAPRAEVAREIFAEIKEKGSFSDPCVLHVVLSFDELAKIEKKYMEADHDPA